MHFPQSLPNKQAYFGVDAQIVTHWHTYGIVEVSLVAHWVARGLEVKSDLMLRSGCTLPVPPFLGMSIGVFSPRTSGKPHIYLFMLFMPFLLVASKKSKFLTSTACLGNAIPCTFPMLFLLFYNCTYFCTQSIGIWPTTCESVCTWGQH